MREKISAKRKWTASQPAQQPSVTYQYSEYVRSSTCRSAAQSTVAREAKPLTWAGAVPAAAALAVEIIAAAEAIAI